ncbi:MAG: RNA methyltransferase, partial [Bdellovibrionaceae bacterium]|nr:RNA methyltransferase [Pseudobdellovibrionaceae bacterium]
VVTTHARESDKWDKVTFKDLRLQLPEKPHFLVFGTGFGLADEVFESCDLLLEPIRGASKDDYRHLSVRSAVSICLDRLMGSC